MVYSESLAVRIRKDVGERPDVTERKMFGGLAFMLNGNMFCGVLKDDLMVRVGAERFDDALGAPGARPMDFTGRPMRGMLFVDGAAIESDEQLHGWLEQTLEFASSLPPKKH